MVENKVCAFTSKMNELLVMEREAEMEETANVLAEYSFRVSKPVTKTCSQEAPFSQFSGAFGAT